MVKLQLLQVLVQRIRDRPQGNRLGVFDLLFCPEVVVPCGMTAVGTVTRKTLAFEARTELDLEVSLAVRLGAFATGEAIVIGLDRDRKAITESAEVIHYTVLPVNCSAPLARRSPDRSLSSSGSRSRAPSTTSP